MHRLFVVLACLGMSVLAACGGGGEDGTATYPPPDFDYTAVLADPYDQDEGPDEPSFLSLQWHLDALGAKSVWTDLGIRGEGVRVAVVDDAIETVHQDLAPNLVPGAVFDYRTGSATEPLPWYFDDDHGTAVTGIILARDFNAFQGAGVAPRAGLAAYNALATSTDADIADALTRDLDANAIYNNSWGSPDNGMLNRAEDTFVAAVRTGIEKGRGGLGSVYVFPAGNGGCYRITEGALPSVACIPIENDSGDGYINRENSNYDGYVNQFGVIAACAVDIDDKAPLYAEPGANLLVCGPSGNSRIGISTTDVLNGFRSDFSGTSASTPMVSGTAALVMSARPNLSWRDVRLILAYSARRNDPTHPGWDLTGVRPFNPYYGFGAADARAAVELAKSWQSVGRSGDESLIRCGPYTRNYSIPIPDDASQFRIDTIDVNDCGIGKIEFVEIGFSATHPYSGDLRVDLSSPRGTKSRLADARICNPDLDGIADNCGNYEDWRFGSVRHLDETATGSWRLQVSDLLPDDAGSGTWTGWNLTIWGRR